MFVYPVLAQRVLGFTAYDTGISLLPPTLLAVISMPVMGKLMSKGVSTIPFVVVGFILFAAYSVASARVSPDVGKWDFFFPLALRALGISMCQLQAMAVINGQVDRQAYYLSYLDAFRLIAIFFVAVIPLVVFLRNKKQTAPTKEAKAAMEAAH